MGNRASVLSRYPNAESVKEHLENRPFARIERGPWFIYAGPDIDARVLGRGITEAQAWADAVWRLKTCRRRAKFVVA
jgi:hypothetical protein